VSSQHFLESPVEQFVKRASNQTPEKETGAVRDDVEKSDKERERSEGKKPGAITGDPELKEKKIEKG